jgi:hypothetical protein
MDPAVPRFALTIGNNSYAHFGVLKNCRQDAHDMKTELEKLSFTTEMLLDYGKADTDAALTSWMASLPVSSPCVALMYFSGHGLEIDGENFLVPIDADGSASKDDVKKKCVSVQNLLDTMSKKFGGAVLVILLLDCCRENPTKSTKFKGSFSKLDLSSNVTRTFVGYATAPGSLADAGLHGGGLNRWHLRIKGLLSRLALNRSIIPRRPVIRAEWRSRSGAIAEVSNGMNTPRITHCHRVGHTFTGDGERVTLFGLHLGRIEMAVLTGDDKALGLHTHAVR